MASTTSVLPPSSSIKHLTESHILTSIPSHYTPSTRHDSDFVSSASIPTIDFSLLTSGSPEQRSQIVRELGEACHDWGFFMVVNHGVPERLREEIMRVCREFFDLPEEEKEKFVGKHVLDPIRCGTSFNTVVEKVFYWRDFLKVFVYPDFHSPHKPTDFSEVSREYSKTIRQLMRELLRGVCESLGIEADEVEEDLELDNGLQILIANFYPRCPEPELALGMPAHSDHGLLTVLMQNDVEGLQLMHNGKWVLVNPVPNSFLVNIGDHVEILSNGKYKSVLHRAVVNNQSTRISIAMAHGPSLDVAVGPMSQLINDDQSAAYRKMKYQDYLKIQQSTDLNGKSCLDMVRV